jgi:hypothetical protein
MSYFQQTATATHLGMNRANYCVPVVSAFVRSLLASGGCPLRDASPRSSGSTLERSEEFAEAPREERE